MGVKKLDVKLNDKVDVIDGYHDVPSKNSADNSQIRDIVGNKTDDESGDSAYSKLYIIEKHLHSIGWTYPELANGITLQKASGIWAAYPTPTEIMPADTQSDPFDIHYIQVNNISANGEYMIVIYSGEALSEVKMFSVPVSRSAAQSQEGSAPGLTIIVAGESRISAAISSSNNAQDTLVIKICGHPY